MTRQAVQWAIGVKNADGWVHQEEGSGRGRFERRLSAIFTQLREGEEIRIRRWQVPYHRRHAHDISTRRAA